MVSHSLDRLQITLLNSLFLIQLPQPETPARQQTRRALPRRRLSPVQDWSPRWLEHFPEGLNMP
jgi:hypothetical protein